MCFSGALLYCPISSLKILVLSAGHMLSALAWIIQVVGSAAWRRPLLQVILELPPLSLCSAWGSSEMPGEPHGPGVVYRPLGRIRR